MKSWVRDFPWLEHNHQDNPKFCKLCKSNAVCSDSASVFVTGCNNYRLESIQNHEKSTGHLRVVAAARVAENPQLGRLPQALLTMTEEVAKKMEMLFDIAYFVAKRDTPFTSFHHLCILEKKHGVELGSTYMNDKACKTFVTYISEQLNKLQVSKFFSVMADSSTSDVGVR